MLYSIIFVISLLAVVKGADITTESAIRIAKQYGVSEFLIGLTIIAFGTSLPELASSITAVLYNTPEMAVSNIMGSNIANIGLVLGLTVIIFSKKIKCDVRKHDIYFFVFSVLAMLVVFIDYRLTFIEGMAFILLYISYTIYSVKTHKMAKSSHRSKIDFTNLAMLAIGLILLIAGANYFIISGIELISMFGISATAFGFIFIAVGTSLPELAASLISMKKKHHGLAVGNIIGSNLFNTFFIFGAMAGIETIPMIKSFYISSMPILVALTALLYLALMRKKLGRFDGFLFLALYSLSVILVF